MSHKWAKRERQRLEGQRQWQVLAEHLNRSNEAMIRTIAQGLGLPYPEKYVSMHRKKSEKQG